MTALDAPRWLWAVILPLEAAERCCTRQWLRSGRWGWFRLAVAVCGIHGYLIDGAVRVKIARHRDCPLEIES